MAATSVITSEVTDSPASIPKPAPETSFDQAAAATKSKSTVLDRFKNAVSSIIRAPGKLIAFIAKEKPSLAAVETTVEEGVITVAQKVEDVAKGVEQTSMEVEKVAEVVAKDAEETATLAEKVVTAVKEVEGSTSGTGKEAAAASTTKSTAAS